MKTEPVSPVARRAPEVVSGENFVAVALAEAYQVLDKYGGPMQYLTKKYTIEEDRTMFALSLVSDSPLPTP